MGSIESAIFIRMSIFHPANKKNRSRATAKRRYALARRRNMLG
jgi:hypothetical protein